MLLGYILNENVRDQFEKYLELSDKLNKVTSVSCFHLVLKSVIDEITAVLSTNIGYLIQDMSKNLNDIIPIGEKSLDMRQLRLLHEYMNNLEVKFKKLESLIRFIKNTKLDSDQNYSSLVDIRSRRMKFEEILELKNVFDIDYFSKFFGKNFKYYDPTDEFIDFQLKKDFEDMINNIFKGSRSRRNTYDKIHLYSCCIYSKSKINEFLKFVTKDRIMLEGSPILLEYFQILNLSKLNQLLSKEMPELPEPK